MLEAPNLRHLYAVAETARLGSLSRAARAVHLSQPALSQALRKIEGRAGQPLFERSGAGMAPTDAGRLFAARLEQAFSRLVAYERELPTRQSGPQRSLCRVLTATQLKALIAVVECGGFTLAARSLGLSEPSVYRAAKELEKICRERFFVRSHRGIEATPAGRRLARCASLAFGEIRQGFEELDELRGRMATRIAIGCLPLLRAHILPTAVNRLARLYPAARIGIVDGPYDELLHALRHGQLDVIMGALRMPAPADDIHQEVLFEDPLSIVVRVGHPVLARGPIGPGRLAKLGWVLPREGTPAREHFCRYFSERGIRVPGNVIECSSLVATRGILLGSDRAALLSARQVKIEVDLHQLAVLPRPLPGTRRPIGITTRTEWRPTSLQERFLAIAREVANESRAP